MFNNKVTKLYLKRIESETSERTETLRLTLITNQIQKNIDNSKSFPYLCS